MCLLLSTTNVCPGDWGQFIPSIIATFVGFVLALIGDYFLQTFLEKRKNKKDVEELFNRLLGELADLKEVLAKLDDYSLDKNPLKTPVWDEAINAGMISLMQSNIRQKLFTVYKKINELNSWYEIKTNYYFSHFDCEDANKRYNSELNSEIDKQEQQLLGTKVFDNNMPNSEKVTIEMVINAIKEAQKK